MNSSLNVLMAKLPECLENEIFKYIIPDATTIEFQKQLSSGMYDRYGSLYEVAFVNNKRLENDCGLYLSRIYKKNGKHRYYITEKTKIYYCNSCDSLYCSSIYCRGSFDTSCSYKSQYVGKDIKKALIKLLL